MINLKSALQVAAALAMLLAPGSVYAEESEEAIMEYNSKSYMKEAPVNKPVDNTDLFQIPTRSKEEYRKNTMMLLISSEAKMRAAQRV